MNENRFEVCILWYLRESALGHKTRNLNLFNPHIWVLFVKMAHMWGLKIQITRFLDLLMDFLYLYVVLCEMPVSRYQRPRKRGPKPWRGDYPTGRFPLLKLPSAVPHPKSADFQRFRDQRLQSSEVNGEATKRNPPSQ